MKITGIDDKLTVPNRIALITDPPIDASIFEQIEKMTCDDLRSPLDPPTPLLSSLRLGAHNGRLLVHTRYIDDHIARNIQCLLDEAEKRAQAANQQRKEAAQQIIDADKDQKQALIGSAIHAFKLPLK